MSDIALRKRSYFSVLLFAGFLIVFLAGCAKNSATPTIDATIVAARQATLTAIALPPTPTASPTATATSTATPTPLLPIEMPAEDLPTATATPTPVPTVAAKLKSKSDLDGNCVNRAKFIKDVTIPDNSKIKPNHRFTKTWRLKNTGTCTWTTAYSLVFAGGSQLSAAKKQALKKDVAPGKQIDLSIILTSPPKKGVYTSKWLLQSASGKKFGVGRKGKTAIFAKIVVPTNAPTLGSVSGFVWHDLCAPQSATDGATPPGCVQRADGSFVADGIYQKNEPRIGGAEIFLGKGKCPATGLAKTTASIKGDYKFTNLKPGDYCVSIDPTTDFNQYIFLPGEWSVPPNGQQTVTVKAGKTADHINFGWDYQFAP